MASLPLSAAPARDETEVIPGAHRLSTSPDRDVTTMELGLLLFFVLIVLASAFGLTADSRDSADWKPTTDGVRAGGRV